MPTSRFTPTFPNVKAEEGTAPEKLYAVHLTLKHSLGTVIRMAEENAPDVKDYLTPEGAFERARTAHELRVSRLKAVQSEYSMVCDHIYQTWYKPHPEETN